MARDRSTFAAAHLAVHTGSNEVAGNRRAPTTVIDAQSGECIPENKAAIGIAS